MNDLCSIEVTKESKYDSLTAELTDTLVQLESLQNKLLSRVSRFTHNRPIETCRGDVPESPCPDGLYVLQQTINLMTAMSANINMTLSDLEI